jgi:RNA polymerase sigma-70 factor (ECF subfamily)
MLVMTRDSEGAGTAVAVGTADLDRLLVEFGPSIYRVTYSILRDVAQAEDAVQETVLKAWSALPKFRGESSLKTWVLRIAHNTAVSMLRRRRDISLSPDDLPERRDHRPGADIEQHVSDRLTAAAVWDALDGLDDLSRAVLVLREVEHMAYEDIAELLRVPLPTVKTRLFRARRVLAQRVGGLQP